MLLTTDRFILFQLEVAAIFILVAWLFFRPRTEEGHFKDYGKKTRSSAGQPESGQTIRISNPKAPPRPKGPFLLEGFVGDGKPFEILGISPHADEKTIRAAHRELMKHYHPDRVGRPDSREWKDAQKIAETLNRARDEMIRKIKQ